MTGPDDDTITQLLRRLEEGDRNVDGEVFSRLYGELHGRARHILGRGNAGSTLQPTVLVHEVYMRMLAVDRPSWSNRQHFLSVAGMAMRQILVDHVRSRRSSKRSAVGERVPVESISIDYEERALDLDELDGALRALAEFDPLMEKAVELRFFAGATIDEVAEILGLSKRTTERRWQAARAWLFKRMRGD